MPKGLRHVGLVVRDAEKELRFYRDLLGFKVLWDRLEEGPFVGAILGLPGVKVRTIKMKLSEGVILELLDFGSCLSQTPGHSITGAGFSHMALTVGDVDGLHRRLSERGTEFLSLPKMSEDGKAKVVFCRDPEGNYLELVQELN